MHKIKHAAPKMQILKTYLIDNQQCILGASLWCTKQELGKTMKKDFT